MPFAALDNHPRDEKKRAAMFAAFSKTAAAFSQRACSAAGSVCCPSSAQVCEFLELPRGICLKGNPEGGANEVPHRRATSLLSGRFALFEALEKFRDFGGWPRAAEQITLRLAAALLADQLQLIRGLYTFRRRHHPEAGAEDCNRPDNGESSGFLGGISDEGAVDLDLVEGKDLQIAQA